MAFSGSYKDKMMKVVDLLNQRTREAEAWKRVANNRLHHLSVLSTHVRDIEIVLQEADILQWLGVSSTTLQMALITDDASIGPGLEAVEEVKEGIVHLLKRLAASARDTTTALEQVLAAGERPDLAVSLPDEEEDDVSPGLTLAEMGAYDHPALSDPNARDTVEVASATDAVVTRDRERRSRGADEKRKSPSSKHKGSSK